MNSEAELLFNRSRLMDELAGDGLNVAIPVKECGIDLLVFLDMTPINGRIAAVPIQVRDASDCFSPSDANISEQAAMLIACVLRAAAPEQSRTLAFTRKELSHAMQVMREASTETEASRRALQNHIFKPFVMSPGKWQRKIKVLIEMDD